MCVFEAVGPSRDRDPPPTLARRLERCQGVVGLAC